MKFLKKQQPQWQQTTLCVSAILSIVVVLLIAGATQCEGRNQTGFEDFDQSEPPLTGGITNVTDPENNAELIKIGQFAVEEYNKEENKNLQFHKVVSARTQVVAGIMYYLIIETIGDEGRKNYEAKVWDKPWENYRSLEDFKPSDDSAGD